MTISKEQWKRIETELSFPFGGVKLKCDDYELSLQVESIGRLKYGIAVYVDGFFKGKWLIEDCEERRRFLRPVQTFVHGARLRADLTKICGGKRAQKKKVEEINKKFTSYWNYWTSSVALRRHLEKHNQELSVVSIGGIEEAVPGSPEAQ